MADAQYRKQFFTRLLEVTDALKHSQPGPGAPHLLGLARSAGQRWRDLRTPCRERARLRARGGVFGFGGAVGPGRRCRRHVSRTCATTGVLPVLRALAVLPVRCFGGPSVRPARVRPNRPMGADGGRWWDFRGKSTPNRGCRVGAGLGAKATRPCPNRRQSASTAQKTVRKTGRQRENCAGNRSEKR